jgi:hypothetical protein
VSHIAQTPSLRHLPSRPDVKRSPTANHICFIFLAQVPVVLVKTAVTYKPFTSIRPQESSTRQPAPHSIASFYTTGGHLTLTKENFLTMTLLNMATAWLPTYNGTLFSYWRHHGIPRRRCLTGRRQDATMAFGFLSQILVFA